MPVIIKRILQGLLLLLIVLAACAAWLFHLIERTGTDPEQLSDFFAQEASRSAFAGEPPLPCRDSYPNRRAWFGALHVHTAASYDATAFGVTNDADDAYAFATGKPLELRLRDAASDATVPTISVGRPLDFQAVTDHAEKLGERRICLSPELEGYDSALCGVYRGDIRLPFPELVQPLVRLASMALFGQDRSARVCGPDGSRCREEARSAWQDNQRATEAWHDRSADCSFTTFHGYEYTLAEQGSNLHRNVIFAGANVPPAVVSAKDKQTPEALWQWLRSACIDSREECDVFSIPHNSNWSSGRMWYPYSLRTDLTPAQQREFAALREHMEPLVEIMQVKGDSECRNGLGSVFGAADEFCDFEKLRAPSELVEDCGDEMGAGNMRLVGCLSRFSYARYALSNGLAEQQRLGANPFRLGIVAATDNHNATAAAHLEKGYLGSSGTDLLPKNRLRGNVDVPGGVARGSPVRYNPGGVAGVWAENNSRDALFSAMRRRETFGTSGPRIEPRLFGGWNLDSALCDAPDMIEQAYATGVPMGSDLPEPNADAPAFLVTASRDAQSFPLQRLQVVKGWIDEEGRTQQAVYDVAGDSEGLASLNTDTCEVSGPGYDQLCSVWRDPDFDADVSAVYYSRVIENPSCRWSTYQCNDLPEAERPASCTDPDVPKHIHERAWTSPIWYTAAE